MYCNDRKQAKAQAQSNADSSGAAWVYYSDTSGNWRAERASGRIGQQGQAWSGVSRIRVEPNHNRATAHN